MKPTINHPCRRVYKCKERRSATVTLPKLASVNDRDIMHHADVSISGNPQLPTCRANALRDQLLAAGFAGEIAISDNMGNCPP